MVKEVHDLDEHTQDAIKRLAGGYSFAKDLRDKLTKIETDELDAGKRDIRKGLQLLRWVGRAERRFDRDAKKIIHDMTELKKLGLPKNLQSREEVAMKEFVVQERTLIDLASMFRGSVKKELENLLTDEALLKKYEDNPSKAQHVREHLLKLVQDCEKHVDKLTTWMESTQVVLRKIVGLDEALKKLDPSY
jgi:hypothetical protein